MQNLKDGYTNAQRIQDLQDERGKLIQQLLESQKDGKPDSAIIQQLAEKDASIKLLLQMENAMQDYVKVKLDHSEDVWRIFHNVDVAVHELPFEVMYIHEDPIQADEFFEVRIGDLGQKWDNTLEKYDIGIGVIDMTLEAGKNRTAYGFDIGILSSDRRVKYLDAGDKQTTRDCPDSALIEGDIIKCTIESCGDVTILKNSQDPKCPPAAANAYTLPDETPKKYQIFIGMKNRFQKVTLIRNTQFHKLRKGLSKFPKDDMRVYVTSMNEGSPEYAKGVATGGKHLLKSGMLLRRLREDGRRVVNYRAGYDAASYDAKVGGPSSLSDFLPASLIRNRIKLSGNLVSVTRRGVDEYAVIVKSLLTGHEENFLGTNAQWDEERNRLLSSGESYLIDLPAPNGMVQTNDLLIAGTKCKTICNMTYSALTITVEDTEKSPAVLLLGGDRSQSIGSVSGALRAYEDLCVLFFDAHNDFRDPDASQYPVVHGSPLFFLLQGQLRDAIEVYNDPATDKDAYPDGTRDAIRFINSTREGRQYWQDLQDSSVGYRGFNWLRDARKINPHRMAFIGLRQTKWEAGSSVGSPLVGLFTNLLGLGEGTYSREEIKAQGVNRIFKRIIEQFRSTFPDIHERDANDPKGRWIPPIMVSWDVDSIDPKDCPCTIFQEPDGLTSEECLAFSDEIARTERLVMMETVEFNPDLWEGYRDEQVIMTINEFEAGPYGRAPREPSDKNKHRLDLQYSLNLIQDMIQRAFKPNAKLVSI